jgi:RNA polymerase sigma-70 factor (ECF subfamily)
MKIVANAAGDRRRRRRVRQTDQISDRQAAPLAGPDVETDRQGFRDALMKGLAELPERQRMAVVLFDVEGYSHREVGEILNVPEGTARSDVFHGRRALREKLAAWSTWKEEH